jgi:hypothetical protein
MSTDYRAYRKASQKFIEDKILETCVDRDLILTAARHLGLLQDNMLVLDHEDDLAVIMDFAVFECRIEGETVFDRYRSQAKKITAMEEEILAACDNAFSSLFQLHATAPAEGTLVMQDLLDMRGEVILTDLASSATSVPGLLFFARILPFPQFNMTSGVTFAFQGDRRNALLKNFKLLRRNKRMTGSPSARRFAAFFALHRSMGVEMRYEDLATRR